MDYGSLIQQAWAITWRHRFLWILGLFAGSVMSTCSPFSGVNYSFGNGGRRAQPEVPPEQFRAPGPFDPEQFDALTSAVVSWVTENIGLIIAIVLLLALFAIAFVIVNLVAQGGMAYATAGLVRGRPVTSGEAWRIGLRLVWRYLALWLVLLGIAALVALVIAVIVALGMGFAVISPDARGVLAVIGLLLGALVFIAALVIGIPLSIVITYAQRAIAAEDTGAVAALRSGYRLLRSNPGTSLLVWLISLALGIAAAIGIVLLLVAALVIFGTVGAIVYAVVGLSTGFVLYAILAALTALALLWLAAGIANAYLWTYWTIAYIRLQGIGNRE